MTDKPKSKRGFACMTPEKRAEIASLGGKASHAKGKAHKWTVAEARKAGQKGGQATHSKGKVPRASAAEETPAT